MSKSIRISKQLNKHYPVSVVEQIKMIADRYHIKSFKYECVTGDKKFYVGEGDTYIGIKEDGTSASFEVVASHNIGASGLSHKIGEQFSMPAGSYLINVYYYDKYYMQVFNVQKALPDRNNSLYFNSI